MSVEVTSEHIAVALAEPLENYGFTEEGIAHYINGAKIIIRQRLGDLDLLPEDALAWVITEAVAARIRNPEGTSTTQVSVDDGSETRTFRRASGTVEILPEWWAMLAPKQAKGGAFTITLNHGTGSPQYDYDEVGWVDVSRGVV